jgi:hypothetical protein
MIPLMYKFIYLCLLILLSFFLLMFKFKIKIETMRLQFNGINSIPCHFLTHKKLNSVALVRGRTIPTERPQLVDEVSASFY